MRILGINLYAFIGDDEKRFDYQTRLIHDTMAKHDLDERKPLIVRFFADGKVYCVESVYDAIECLNIKDGVNIAETDSGNMAIVAYYNGNEDIVEIMRNATDEDFDDDGELIL